MNPLTRFKKIIILRFVLFGLLCFGALVLICYTALAQTHRGGVQPSSSNEDDRVSSTSQTPDLVSQLEIENDPAFVQRRREWLDRFFGLGVLTPALWLPHVPCL